MLNERKLEIYFSAIKETQGEDVYNKMKAKFTEIVNDRMDQLYAMGVEEAGQIAYLETVDMLVEVYEEKYPNWFVTLVNEKATA